MRNKYGAIKVKIDGFTFDSKAEGKRYGDLLMLQRAKIISELEVHPRFELHVNGAHIGFYTGDFAYKDSTGAAIIEDVKSPVTRKTTDYQLRKKLMKACLGIEITEVVAR